MDSQGKKKPKPLLNLRLRQVREEQNFTLQGVADNLYEMCVKEGRKSGISADTVGRWERGLCQPEAHYRAKLCQLYGKNSRELGLFDPAEMAQTPERMQETRPEITSQKQTEKSDPSVQIFTLDGNPLLTIRACNGTMSLQLEQPVVVRPNASYEIQLVLQGVQAMPYTTQPLTRRKLLELGAAALVGGIPIPDGRHVSAEERVRLSSALGESIAAGWKLFHTAENAQVLAVGQAQLYLLQQNHARLHPSIQPTFYSAVYRLIGATLHFQGRYEEAYQDQEKAYISALEGADSWNMAQSRSWQAYGLKACGNYPEALQAADAALRLISQRIDTESIRLRARLLAFSAENAALLHDDGEVQARLSASEELLEYLSDYHEEFDHVSWLQQAGICALSLGQYGVAVTRLQQALDELPAQWTLRSVSTAIPLATTLVRLKERNRALAIAKETLPTVKFIQSPALTLEFITFLQTELLTSFSNNDESCRIFVAEAQRQLTVA